MGGFIEVKNLQALVETFSLNFFFAEKQFWDFGAGHATKFMLGSIKMSLEYF